MADGDVSGEISDVLMKRKRPRPRPTISAFPGRAPSTRASYSQCGASQAGRSGALSRTVVDCCVASDGSSSIAAELEVHLAASRAKLVQKLHRPSDPEFLCPI